MAPKPLTNTSTLVEVREHLGDAAREAIEFRSTPVDKRDDDFDARMSEHIANIHFADQIEAALAAEERGKLAVAEAEQRAKGPKGAFEDQTKGPRSGGREFVESEGYAEFAQRGGTGMFSAEVRALLYSDGAEGAGLLRPVGQPYFKPGPEMRRLFVRDLLGGAQPTGLALIPYIQEKDAVTNETGADMTSEGSAKHEVTMEFQAAEAPVRKITAWIPVTTEILADAPTLRGYIDRRIEYMIMLREEQQILKGNGTPPQIRGIYETTGTQTQAAVAGDVPATLAAAYGKIENVDGDVSGVVMNPLDYWGAVATRHATQFDSGFGGNAPAELASISWGEPVVRTRSLLQTECLVGDWRMGATLFQREGVNITVGDQHADFFIENKVAIKGESRIALAVEAPKFFVEVTLDLTA